MAKIKPDNIHESMGRYILADGMDPVIDLENSHGSWLVDAKNGREYLDLFSMFASMSIGYNHPYILENQDRLTEAARNKPTNSDIYSTQLAEFIDTMGRLAQPDYLPYAFYIEGGTLGVENALKTAFDWKARKNISDGNPNGAQRVIHFKQCFHGRSGYTLSLTDSHDPRKTRHFPKFDWPRITTPSLTFPVTDEILEKTVELEQKSLEEIKSAIHKYNSEISAIIIEPIQGEGGDNHFRQEFFESLREVADEDEIVLIYDEVQTGVGITGKMWCHEHFGESALPDIICFGKKTQVCGLFAGKRIDEVDQHVFHESSRLNSTWGGNLTDMVRFTLYLDVIEREDLVEHAEKMGSVLLSGIEDLQEKHPGKIFNARGKGLFCAFDCNTPNERDQLRNLIQDEGAIILGSGEKSIRFRPHLNISADEINQGTDMIDRALKRL